MFVTIARVHENLFSGQAVSITAPGADGELTILSTHEPLVVPLTKGIITVRTAEHGEVYECEGGVLEVSDNQVTVLL